MKSSLLFNFSIDKEKKTITVKRSFDAPLNKVWAAWTESDLLDQWWAPKPYEAKTKSMNFREGGTWLYAMLGPNNFKEWSKADFTKIEALKSFSATDAFCDEQGNINPKFPQAEWTNSFSEADNNTLVSVVIKYGELSDLEQILEMGFQDGFTAGLENLDTLLASSN